MGTTGKGVIQILKITNFAKNVNTRTSSFSSVELLVKNKRKRWTGLVR